MCLTERRRGAPWPGASRGPPRDASPRPPRSRRRRRQRRRRALAPAGAPPRRRAPRPPPRPRPRSAPGGKRKGSRFFQISCARRTRRNQRVVVFTVSHFSPPRLAASALRRAQSPARPSSPQTCEEKTPREQPRRLAPFQTRPEREREREREREIPRVFSARAREDLSLSLSHLLSLHTRRVACQGLEAARGVGVARGLRRSRRLGEFGRVRGRQRASVEIRVTAGVLQSPDKVTRLWEEEETQRSRSFPKTPKTSPRTSLRERIPPPKKQVRHENCTQSPPALSLSLSLSERAAVSRNLFPFFGKEATADAARARRRTPPHALRVRARLRASSISARPSLDC